MGGGGKTWEERFAGGRVLIRNRTLETGGKGYPKTNERKQQNPDRKKKRKGKGRP